MANTYKRVDIYETQMTRKDIYGSIFNNFNNTKIGVNGAARNTSRVYFGVNGTARVARYIYLGVNNQPRMTACLVNCKCDQDCTCNGPNSECTCIQICTCNGPHTECDCLGVCGCIGTCGCDRDNPPSCQDPSDKCDYCVKGG